MSDREFENYLTLLSGLLRLDRQQRGEISKELRSHLEDRLEELMEQGVGKEEAVRQALAEFGDAAGLAGQFVAISRNRKRRWLMRVTTFSVAATLLIAAGLTIFWPGRNAAPGVAAAVAQAPFAANQAPPGVDPFAAGEPTLQEKLNKRIDLDVVELPLKDVLTYLQENTGIQIGMKTKKLEEASVSPDTPVTKSLRSVRVSTVLDLVLGDNELTYVEKDGLLLITTPEDAENNMLIRVYDCRDLLAMTASIPGRAPTSVAPTGPIVPPPPTALPGAPGVQPGVTPSDPFAPRPAAPPRASSAGRQADPEQERRAGDLIDLVVTIVDPQSWAEVGGPGSIDSYSGLVVVAQTEDTHRKVERLFDMLREAAGLEVPKAGKVVR